MSSFTSRVLYVVSSFASLGLCIGFVVMLTQGYLWGQGTLSSLLALLANITFACVGIGVNAFLLWQVGIMGKRLVLFSDKSRS